MAASGASGEVLEIGVSFLTITLPSMPLVALGVTSSAPLRAAGDAWRSMAMTMVAVVLDPILIVWLRWDVTGAAISILCARMLMRPFALAGAAWAAVPGILWANAFTNVIAGAMAAWLAWRYIHKLNRAAPQERPARN